jgi:Cdc6-like AAA superfamily ATPase
VAGGLSSLFKRKPRKAQVASVAPVRELTDLFAHDTQRSEQEKNSVLPRFKSTAADQVDRRRSDRFTAMRMKLRNAFTPAQPVADRRLFAGRSGILASMISAIEDQRLHLVLYGERGIGKTSLLHMLAEAAREARYIVVYSSCGSASNFQDTFRTAAADIPLLYHTGFGPTTEEAEAGSTLAELLPENFTPRQFADLCVKLTGTRALIILDEFDRAESHAFRRDLAEVLKSLSDRSVRVQVVIGGVAGDLGQLVEHIPSIRRNILALRVPLMTEDEIEALIATGERGSGLVFDAMARDLISTICCGWPYVASLICHHAGLHAIDSARSTVLPDDVLFALDEALQELRARMGKSVQVQVTRMVNEGMGKLLTLMAGAALKSGGAFSFADIDATAQKAADAQAAKQLIEQLCSQHGLLERREDAYGSHYAFLEDGLPQYLWFLGTKQSFEDRRVKTPRVSNG